MTYSPTIFAYIALFGWIPVALLMFAVLPVRRAAAVAVVGAWLLLPPYRIPIAHFPDYSKNTAATIGMVLGTLIFAPDRILAFRPRWFDLPMLVWCCWPIATSLHNGLGLYDGLSGMLANTINWALPYLIGRMYFNDAEGLRELAVAMVGGGLAYILPCLFEIKMSAILLPSIYGFGPYQGTRWGLERARVFFWTGLDCGMWMTAAALTAWWLRRCGALRRIGPVPFGGPLLTALMGTAILCRSLGAIILLVGGIVVLRASTRFQTRLLLGALVLFGPIYAGVRIPNLWSGRQVVQLARDWINEERAHSLEYRLQNEEVLIAKAIQQPVFGWGGWGRSCVYGLWDADGVFHPEDDEDPDHMVPFDGMWLAILGTNGYVGLALWYLILELPTALFVLNFPVRLWGHPRAAAAALAATLLGLYMIDCTLNGFLNIIYVTLTGGLIGLRPAHLGIGPPAGGLARMPAPREGSRPTPAPPEGRPARPSTAGIRLAGRYRSLGRTLKERGRPVEAEAAWRHALDLLTAAAAAHPDDADVRRRWCDCANDLAWLRLHHPEPAYRDVDSAIAMARQVVERCPDCGTYWNTMGVAYLRAGDYESAVAALDRAIALGDGGTAFDDVFLAMAHAHLGDLERARHWLARAILRMERDHPAHSELARFCDEARSLLFAGGPSVA